MSRWLEQGATLGERKDFLKKGQSCMCVQIRLWRTAVFGEGTPGNDDGILENGVSLAVSVWLICGTSRIMKTWDGSVSWREAVSCEVSEQQSCTVPRGSDGITHNSI